MLQVFFYLKIKIINIIMDFIANLLDDLKAQGNDFTVEIGYKDKKE